MKPYCEQLIYVAGWKTVIVEGEKGAGSKGWAESAPPPPLVGVGLLDLQSIGGDQNQITN